MAIMGFQDLSEDGMLVHENRAFFERPLAYNPVSASRKAKTVPDIDCKGWARIDNHSVTRGARCVSSRQNTHTGMLTSTNQVARLHAYLLWMEHGQSYRRNCVARVRGHEAHRGTKRIACLVRIASLLFDD